MFDFLDNQSPLFFVSLGAVPGALLRMKLADKFFKKTNSNYISIILVNSLATFLLGLFLGIHNKIDNLTPNNSLYLFICVGFLGSFSTFSSFILEAYYSFEKQQWLEFFVILIVSILVAFLLASVGYHLGNETITI